MINSITLSGVASYSPSSPVTVQTNKRVNLFYGLNGAGKSTLGNYLQSLDDAKYGTCSVTPEQSQDNILAYNQTFVKNNFYENSQQKGIFTLSEENKEAKQAIENANNTIAELRTEIEGLEESVEGKNKEIKNEEKELLETVWKKKSEHGGGSLSFCLKGAARSKDSFLTNVKSATGKSQKDIAQLSKEAEELNQQNVEQRQGISEVEFHAIDIETKTIFAERIVGSGDSYLKAMIEQLDNSGWVQRGMGFIEDQDACPFCQQTLPNNFKDEVAKLFDETYQQKQAEILRFKNAYNSRAQELIESLNGAQYKADYVVATADFESTVKLLKRDMQTNLERIERKYQDPSSPIELINNSSTLVKLNCIITNINKEIAEFNDKVRNKAQHLTDIKTGFWQVIRSECENVITSSESNCDKLKVEVQALQTQISEKNVAIDVQEEVVSTNRKQITNIESTVDQINTHLKSIGVQGFTIEKASNDADVANYKLVRAEDNGNEEIFHTLSEGEKTLITFLYFLELCGGTVAQDARFMPSDRIIVIDDPISSLSHNFVYDVATLIHHKVIKENFDQVFVLTHNLFFYHELLKLARNSAKNYNLFRVIKAKHTAVKSMQRDEIQNDYQMYWQVIKDCKSDPVYANMLPNAMRNILEYYFNFVHKKDSLKIALDELSRDEADFRSFHRLINRESHSDAINIRDFENIEVERYIEKFKDIFDKTGHIEHYQNMMGEEAA